jgi:NAD(P)-dependent dehydrogenase (short-subunit alcohol dehydrogenase family)
VNFRNFINFPLTFLRGSDFNLDSSKSELSIQTIKREPKAEAFAHKDNKLLEGKNVLITGAGRNIGRSLAIEMAKQGANIFFTEINQKLCTELEQEVNEFGVRSRGFLSDISKVENTDSIFSELVKNGVSVDILVNNVGIKFRGENIKYHFDLEEWQRTFNTNVFGPMYLTTLVSNTMMNRDIHGSIIFITSLHQWTFYGIQSYSSSKAALGMIIKELALELAPYKIRVNGIAPGWIGVDEQGNPYHHKNTPLHNSSIDPCYIGRAAVYLASDYFSHFTTGTVLKIDAGLSLHNHRSLSL